MKYINATSFLVWSKYDSCGAVNKSIVNSIVYDSYGGKSVKVPKCILLIMLKLTSTYSSANSF